MMRTIRLLLALTLLLAMTSTLTACGDSETADETTTTEAASDDAIADEPMSDEDLRAALEEQYGDATWYPNIMWIGTDQVLLANITRVETDLGTEGTDYDTAVEISDALWDVLESDVINIRIIAADGLQLLGGGTGSPMSEAMDLPAPPTSADELQAWVDEVYGDSGEDWYMHLKGIEISDSESGYDGTSVVVLRTDLNDRESETYDQAVTMAQAVTSSGQTMADSWVAYMGSGEHLSSGGLMDAGLSY